MKHARNFLVASLAVLAACSDQSPTASVEPPATARPSVTRVYNCTANVEAGTVSCGPEASGARREIYGTQDRDVRVNTFNTNYNVFTQLYTFDATVTNLRREAIGTRDGVHLDPRGVRLFFGSGPTVTSGVGAVLPLNPDGTDLFLLGLAPYYQYDEVLRPGQTSYVKGWTFLVPLTVRTFHFNLYVSTEVGPSPS